MNPWHIVDGECIKRKFGTAHSAKLFADSSNIDHALTQYQCPVCGAWHNTSGSPTSYNREIDLTPIEIPHPETAHWLRKLNNNARYRSRKKVKRHQLAKPAR